MRELKSRRFLIAIFSISCLFLLGYTKEIDVASAIAAIAIGIAGASAADSFVHGKTERNKDDITRSERNHEVDR